MKWPWRRQYGRRLVVWSLVAVGLLAYVRPLRNLLLYPVFPTQWRDVDSFRLLQRHLGDLFFPMDVSPYFGSCGDVTRRLGELRVLERVEQLRNTCRVHTQRDWDDVMRRLRHRYDDVTAAKLRYFRPALTEEEQRTLLGNLLVVVSALEAFNVTYVAVEGTLVGAVRHAGLVPWDDDADVTFDANQWKVAKRVLSCVPGYELKIHSDFLWKFYRLDSPLWKGEAVTRFPYVDLFPYTEDGDLVWPLVIWLKDKMLFPTRQVFPAGWADVDQMRLKMPGDPGGVLGIVFGDVSTCESRIFDRRERRLMPTEERVRVNCRLLHDFYPFVHDTHDTQDTRKPADDA